MLWINIWRAAVFLICAISLIVMVGGFIRYRKGWNKKTRDYWYGRVMWTVAGMALSFEGIDENVHLRYGLIFVSVAALATLKGNLQRGPWGYKKDMLDDD